MTRAERLARMYELIVELDALTDTEHTINDAIEYGLEASGSDRRDWQITSGSFNKAKRFCRHGHEYTEENTYFSPQRKRMCRECMRESTRRRDAARREKRA